MVQGAEIIQHNESYRVLAKQIVRFSSPFFLARGLELGGEFVTAAFLSNLGLDYLATTALVTTTRAIIVNSARVSLYAVGMLAARAHGETSSNAMKAFYLFGQFYALGLSICIIPLLCFVSPILTLLGQDASMSEYAEAFFRTFSTGIPALLMQVVNQQIIFSKFKPWVVTLINLLQNIVLIPLAYVFIFVLNDQSIASRFQNVGYAYSTAYWLAFIGTCIYLRKNETFNFLREKIFMALHDRFIMLKEIIKNAFGIGIQSVSETLSATILMGLAGILGADNLASAEAATQYLWTIGIPTAVIAQSAAVLISQKIGSDKGDIFEYKKHVVARKIGYITFLIAMSIPIIFLIVVSAASSSLANLFMHQATPEVVVLTEKLLFINAAIQILNVFRFCGMSFLRAYKDTIFSAVFCFINQCAIGGTFSWLLGVKLNQSVLAIFLTSLATIFLGSAVASFRWLWINGKSIQNNFPAQDLQGGVRQSSNCCSFLYPKIKISDEDERRRLIHVPQ